MGYFVFSKEKVTAVFTCKRYVKGTQDTNCRSKATFRLSPLSLFLNLNAFYYALLNPLFIYFTLYFTGKTSRKCYVSNLEAPFFEVKYTK
jgi:hypothetical protein